MQGIGSLIEHPGLMTHASIPREEREKVGIADSLAMVSVGIEDVGDMKKDMDNAFNTR